MLTIELICAVIFVTFFVRTSTLYAGIVFLFCFGCLSFVICFHIIVDLVVLMMSVL